MAHIHEAVQACCRYRKDALYEHFTGFDPIIQALLRPVLFPGDSEARTTEKLKYEASDPYGDLDERWASVLVLYPRAGTPVGAPLSKKDLDSLYSIGWNELRGGGSLPTVERKLAALTVEAQDKTMRYMMQEIIGSSPAELSEYLRSLPRDAPWRSSGIQTLLKSLPPGSGEALAWSKELTP